MFVDKKGNDWVCGGNQKGELGWATTQINSPQKNNNLSGIVAVGGRKIYSVFLDNAGNIYTCGNNKYGQLGLGDKKDRHTQSTTSLQCLVFIVATQLEDICRQRNETEMFKSIEKKQNKPLMDKLKSAKHMPAANMIMNSLSYCRSW